MIKKFNDFILEELSYLSGHRQPLYHFTSALNLILRSDLLKMGTPARGSFGKTKSISVTRNVDFSDAPDTFIELDNTKLYNDGYKSLPVDEWAWDRKGIRSSFVKTHNMNKSKFAEVVAGKRGTKHGLENLPKVNNRFYGLQTEFEERFFTDIKDLGKYIISINFPVSKDEPGSVWTSKYEDGVKDTEIRKYLEKYPHIKVYNIDKDNHRKKVEITDKYTNPVQEPVLKESVELLNNLETILVDLLEPESPYKVELPKLDIYPASLSIEGKNEYNRQSGKWESEFDFDYIKTFLEPLDFYMKKEYDRIAYCIKCSGYSTAGLDYNELIKEIGTRDPYKVVITGFKSIKHQHVLQK